MIARHITTLIALASITTGAATQRTMAEVIHNLGTLGGNFSSAADVNSSGHVVGSSNNADNQSRGFIYTGTPGVDGQMLDLGTLGGDISYAKAISDTGYIAGDSYRVGTDFTTYRAFRYSGIPGVDGVMTDLGDLAGGTSYGYGVNNHGDVTGDNAIGGVEHASVYLGTPGDGGQWYDLGTLGGDYSYTADINDSGQIVGDSELASFDYRAIAYVGTPGVDGQMYDLGTFGGAESSGYGINNAGQMVGGASLPDETWRAFLYDGAPGSGTMHNLGTLGGDYSFAYDINDLGAVVGVSRDAGGTQRPFLYVGTPGIDGQMINLQDWINDNSPTASFWSLTFAQGISNTGLIAGTGLYDDGPGGLADGQRAFLIDASSLMPEQVIPEPAAGLMLLAGLPMLLRQRAAGTRSR